MVVVHKNAARGDQAIISHFDASLDVELHAAPNKDPIPDEDGWARHPTVVIVEEDGRLEHTTMAQADLMRPGHLHFGDVGFASNLRATTP